MPMASHPTTVSRIGHALVRVHPREAADEQERAIQVRQSGVFHLQDVEVDCFRDCNPR